MTSFATLKKSSNTLDRLTKEIEKINAPATTERTEDTRFWKLERDKSGNGSAVIRFLPAPAVDGDDALPWVRVFDHGFKGPTGKWYIEKSLTTIGQKDPLSEYNSKLWNASSDDNSPERKQARAQKRRLHYISNIMVISDPKNPENEGKIFLFKYGKKIFDKIHDCFEPPFDEMGRPKEHPKYDPTNAFNPFDLWKVANFKIRIRTVDGYPNYEQSIFESPSAVSDDDDKLEKLWKSEYSLKEFLDPKHFKSYDELKHKLEEVLGDTEVVTKKTASTDDAFKSASKRQSVVEDDTPPFSVDEDDDDLAAFKALAD